MLLNSFASALTNLALLVAIPAGIYLIVQRWRRGTTTSDLARRVGFQVGDASYLRLAAALSVLAIAAILIWPPDADTMIREGSAWTAFVGLGVTPLSVLMALIYGVVQTGFAEEFLFRGLIAGALSRRLSLHWANIIQAFIFLLPHLLLLAIMPEMWPLLVVVFLGALAAGWIRIRSGSILGPWMIHAAVNVTMALSVASRTL